MLVNQSSNVHQLVLIILFLSLICCCFSWTKYSFSTLRPFIVLVFDAYACLSVPRRNNHNTEADFTWLCLDNMSSFRPISSYSGSIRDSVASLSSNIQWIVTWKLCFFFHGARRNLFVTEERDSYHHPRLSFLLSIGCHQMVITSPGDKCGAPTNDNFRHPVALRHVSA